MENTTNFNLTTTSKVWEGSSLNILYDIVYPILSLVVISSNGLVVWSSGLILNKGRIRKKSTYIFLGNLSLMLIINAVVQQMSFWYTFHDNETSRQVCKWISGLKAAACTANIYSVGLIAIDRYLFITHGMQYERWVYPNRARLLVLGTWIIGAAVGIVPMFWWNKPRIHSFKVCLPVIFASKAYVLGFVINSLVPVVIVAISYSVILSKALLKINQLDQNLNNNVLGAHSLRVHVGSTSSIETITNNTKSMWSLFTKSASINTEKKWKAVKVVLLTTLTLIFTWVPFHIVWCVWVYLCDDKTIGSKAEPKFCSTYSTILRPMFFTLALVHDLATPIIYVWWHKGFKEFLTLRWQASRFGSRKPSQDISSVDRSSSV